MAGLLDPKGKLVDTEEAALLLRLSRRTLEDKRVDGTGPPFYKLGHGKNARVVYKVVDLDVWIEQFRQTPEGKKPSPNGNGAGDSGKA